MAALDIGLGAQVFQVDPDRRPRRAAAMRGDEGAPAGRSRRPRPPRRRASRRSAAARVQGTHLRRPARPAAPSRPAPLASSTHSRTGGRARPGRRARRQHTPRSPMVVDDAAEDVPAQRVRASRGLSTAAQSRADAPTLPEPARRRDADSAPMSDAHSRATAGRGGGAARPARRLPLFRCRTARVLYVGKARNLKKRVSSYFQKNHGGTRIGHMVEQDRAHGDHGGALRGRGAAARKQPDQDAEPAVQHPVPRRQELPLPEDSVPSCGTSRFPRVAYYRGAVESKHRYFGPYPSAWAVKEAIQLLQKVFRLRTCEDTVFTNRTRPCLLYQIKRCSGALRGPHLAAGLRAGCGQRRALPARRARRR